MGKISDYTRVLASKLADVFVCDQADNGVTTTKSVTVEQIGDTIAGEQVHSSLDTDDKTLIGGINENKDKVGDLSSLTTTNKDSLVDAVNEVNGGKLDKFITYQTTSNAVTLLFDNIGDMAIVLINRGYNAYDGAFVLMTGGNNNNALVVELYKGSSIDTVYKAPDGKGFTISSTEMSGSKIVVIPISGTPTISG